MKKHFTLLAVWGMFFVSVPAFAEVYADDFVSQKQYVINNRSSCQAVRIHKDWFLTAAHCVYACKTSSCNLRVLLAVGEVSAWAQLNSSDVFIPREYDPEKSLSSMPWDVALLHFRPASYEYRTAEGGVSDYAGFSKAMSRDPDLEIQWKGTVKPDLRPLVVYSGREVRTLQDDVIVPRWTSGALSYRSGPDHILYLGKNIAAWISDGFGVDEGNSGGAVHLAGDGNILGIVSAKRDQALPVEVSANFPEFGQTSEFFLFTGFSKKTTWPFIKNTLSRFGDSVKTTKLKNLEPKEPVSVNPL